MCRRYCESAAGIRNDISACLIQSDRKTASQGVRNHLFWAQAQADAFRLCPQHGNARVPQKVLAQPRGTCRGRTREGVVGHNQAKESIRTWPDFRAAPGGNQSPSSTASHDLADNFGNALGGISLVVRRSLLRVNYFSLARRQLRLRHNRNALGRTC